LLVVNSLISIV